MYNDNAKNKGESKSFNRKRCTNVNFSKNLQQKNWTALAYKA